MGIRKKIFYITAAVMLSVLLVSYGVTETAQLQKNIILSHSTSVGKPLSEETVRGTLLMVLQNLV